jgi:hypothetical protein
MPNRLLPPALLVLTQTLLAQTLLAQTPSPYPDPQPADLQQVLQRLDRLEEQNRELMTELRALRQQLAASQPAAPATQAAAALQEEVAPDSAPAAPLQDQIEVQQQRTAQLDQEKISTEHKLPLTLTGMLLENSFWTGKGGGGGANPTIAPAEPGPVNAGGTFRQSVLGVKFDGPDIVWGGKVTGSAYVDFFGGTGAALNQYVRLRVASLNTAWKNTTVTVALDKPIIAPREPDSLAQVGVSPLTSAGNLWLWQPQVRVEQRFNFSDSFGLRAQAGIYQTAEGGTGVDSEYQDYLTKSRPGYEGRFEFWAGGETNHRIEIAPGFHVSSSHLLEQSTPSQVFSVDWLFRPFSRIDFTGQFFHGENVGVLGGLQQGISIVPYDGSFLVRSVGATGGWGQIKLRLAPRLTMNLYGGQEDDRNRDLLSGAIGKNQTYAGNLMYRFGSNILAAFESSQTRTTYLFSGTRLFPHYDLALAYLF